MTTRSTSSWSQAYILRQHLCHPQLKLRSLSRTHRFITFPPRKFEMMNSALRSMAILSLVRAKDPFRSPLVPGGYAVLLLHFLSSTVFPCERSNDRSFNFDTPDPPRTTPSSFGMTAEVQSPRPTDQSPLRPTISTAGTISISTSTVDAVQDVYQLYRQSEDDLLIICNDKEYRFG